MLIRLSIAVIHLSIAVIIMIIQTSGPSCLWKWAEFSQSGAELSWPELSSIRGNDRREVCISACSGCLKNNALIKEKHALSSSRSYVIGYM